MLIPGVTWAHVKAIGAKALVPTAFSVMDAALPSLGMTTMGLLAGLLAELVRTARLYGAATELIRQIHWSSTLA